MLTLLRPRGSAGRLTHAEAHHVALANRGRVAANLLGLRHCSSRWAGVSRATCWGFGTALESGAGVSRATCWGFGTALESGAGVSRDPLGASALLWPARRHLATSPPLTR